MGADERNRPKPAGPARQAVVRAYALLIQQATLVAYVDTFRRLGFLCLVSVLLVLLFRRVASPREPAALDQH